MSADVVVEVTGPPAFGARLRQERERRNISITAIAEKTKILGALLEGLENDDVSRWPAGLYRRAFMRAYATAIGLDPEVTVKEFLERFPEPEEALGQPLTPAPAPALATASTAPAPLAKPSTYLSPLGINAGLRLNMPPLGAWFREGAVISPLTLRVLAAAVDLFALSVMGVLAYAVLGMLWAPLSFAAAVYYTGSILILGNTPGVCLFANPEATLRRSARLSWRSWRSSAEPGIAADSTAAH